MIKRATTTKRQNMKNIIKKSACLASLGVALALRAGPLAHK
jgi:hypothetical protein